MEMDEVWRRLERAGGALPAIRLSGLRAGVALGVELSVFSNEGDSIRLQV